MQRRVVVHLEQLYVEVLVDDEVAADQVEVAEFALHAVPHRLEAVEHDLLAPALFGESRGGGQVAQ